MFPSLEGNPPEARGEYTGERLAVGNVPLLGGDSTASLRLVRLWRKGGRGGLRPDPICGTFLAFAWGFSVIIGIALVLSGSAWAALSEPGILTYVNNSAVFKYMVWNGTSFDAAADGPAMQGTDVIRHIRSARSDDGHYVAVLAEAYNTGSGLHNVYGTVWDGQEMQWINTTNLWFFTDTAMIQYKCFDVAALSSNEFVAVGKNESTTLENAGWKALRGWAHGGGFCRLI